MRSVVAFAAAVALVAGCKKSSVATAPLNTDPVSVAGTWSGCLTQPQVTCAPVSMVLADSSLTDSTANVTGTGNWGNNVVIKGKLLGPALTLNATKEGVLQGWSYTATLSGNSITGNMTIPGVDSSFQAVFTRAP